MREKDADISSDNKAKLDPSPRVRHMAPDRDAGAQGPVCPSSPWVLTGSREPLGNPGERIAIAFIAGLAVGGLVLLLLAVGVIWEEGAVMEECDNVSGFIRRGIVYSCRRLNWEEVTE